MKSDPKPPEVPGSLLDLQKWFGRLEVLPLRDLGEYRLPIYDSALISSIEEIVSPGPSLSAAERIGIYNQQYWFRLFVIMQEKYPSLTRLFGAEEFNFSIAEPFLLKYPPSHWSIKLLGNKLPQWIEENYTDEDRHLVLSAARIDEAYERLENAPILPAPTESDYSKKKLYLQPAAVVLELEGDYFAFREELLKQEPDYWVENDFPSIRGSSERDFVLYKTQGEIGREPILASQKVLLKAFEKGALLEEACALLEDQEETDIGGWFKTWAEKGWFTTAVCL